jgi:hypothetical protein
MISCKASFIVIISLVIEVVSNGGVQHFALLKVSTTYFRWASIPYPFYDCLAIPFIFVLQSRVRGLR